MKRSSIVLVSALGALVVLIVVCVAIIRMQI
jgi:hypothetical protein